MGKYFFDKFSLLHFSVGVIAYFWNIPFLMALIMHMIFEVVENSYSGIQFINKYLVNEGILSFPGGKRVPDTMINIISDNIFFILGWLVSNSL